MIRTHSAWLAAVLLISSSASAQVEAPPYGTNDYGGTGEILNILPSGQKGVFDALEQAQMATVCDPLVDTETCPRDEASYPAYTIDQMLMYDGLLKAAPTLTPDQLTDFFKDTTFSIPPHKIARSYSPGNRPGVVVIRDSDYNVPRIYATNRADGTFATGYVSAEDRLFFMDVLRHVGLGRMSEFLGPSRSNLAMDRDAYRSAGYSEAELQWMVDHLDEEYPTYGPITQAGMQDFADGVNQYITEAIAGLAPLPAEYVTLQQNPDLWKTTDTVAVASLVTGIFGVGGGGELANCRFLAELETHYGDPVVAREVFEDFNQDDDPEKPRTSDISFPYMVQGPVDPAAVACPDPESLASAIRGASFIAGNNVDGPHGPITLLERDSRASNALLVGASRSATGYPIAVFGPQVGYFAPQILMEMEIHAEANGPGDFAIDARGAAFPGISQLVLLGRGRDFAWSATSAGSDLVDLVAAPLCEPDGITPPSFDSRHYVYDGQCLPMQVRQDVWLAKPGPAGLPDGPPAFPEPSQQPPPLPELDDDPLFTFAETLPGTGEYLVSAEVLRTIHGVVQSFATIGGAPHAYVRQRITFFHEFDGAAAFIQLNSPDLVTDAASFQQAFGTGLNSTFNWFYADSKNIAFEVSGNYPIRAAGVDHDLPYFATGQWDWQGFSNAGFPASPPTDSLASWHSDRLPFAQIPKDMDPAKGYMTSWNNAQAPGWNAADTNLSYGPLHRSLPLDDRISADPSITLTELVQYMEDAGTVDLRGDKVVPVIAQLIGPAPTGNANADLGLQVLSDWNAAGAHRRDLDGDGVYDHAAAVALMDAWWTDLTNVVFATLGGSVRGAMPLGRHDAPGPVGSAFISGWYGIVHKDLRGVMAGSPVAPWSRLYCGDGNLATCKAAVTASLGSAVASLGPDPATWDADESGDRIKFSLAGTANVPDMQWVNRPTFQQAVEFRLDAQSADTDGDGIDDPNDNCPYVANPDQQDSDGDVSYGDACECGDVDRDGDVDVADATLLRDARRSQATLPADPLCDTNHDRDCSNIDESRIEQFAVYGMLTKSQLSCREKVGPGGP